MKRRVLPCILALLLAACGSSPPVRWYELRPPSPEPLSSVAAPAEGGVWSLSPTVSLPGPLDRDTLLVARDDAGLVPLVGHRWAEPLRDSVPRLLLNDLRRLRGDERVWLSPPPSGVAVAQRLTIAIEQLQVQSGGRTLALAATASWQGPDLAAPPQLRRIDLAVPLLAGAGTPAHATPDAIASAHRLALWRLARWLAAGP